MRLIIALSAVAIVGLTSSAMESASASAQNASVNLTQSPGPVEADCHVASGGRAGGFFGRIMEIERRKNAWFRTVFS